MQFPLEMCWFWIRPGGVGGGALTKIYSKENITLSYSFGRISLSVPKIMKRKELK